MGEIGRIEIDTGDHVDHGPSGETWVVAYTQGKHIYCCGWPLSIADEKDCKPVKKATIDQRERLLVEMAGISKQDPRKSYAKARLEARALLPCPCCEGEAWQDKCEARTPHEGLRTYYSVRCRDCDLRTPAIVDPELSIKIWNTRPEPTKKN